MTPVIDNGILGTDLDANGFMLLNIGGFDPFPSDLVATTDSRLSDARNPLDGSVINASVSASAAIVQSKLALNGNIPPAWMGTTSTTAAQGDLVQYLSEKGQPNGYASLDGGSKVPVSQIPVAVGTGTVTSVGLTMPAEFAVSGSPISGAGTLAAVWANEADQSWFGNKSGGSAVPQFYTTALPASLIPSLDASIVNSGVFAAALLPAAVGIGGGHAAGVVPDPGAGGGGALATDYLARDMTYKPIPGLGPTYQPMVPDPTFSPSTNPTGPKTVVFLSTLAPVNIFYSLTSAVTGFIEITPGGSISLAATATVWCYAAKTGYNNSNVVSYTNPNP